MSTYVFIQSRDPFASRDADFLEETAIAAKERGHEVTVFLVQNGVFAARAGLHRLDRLIDTGVTLLADDLSLRERGITAEEMVTGVQEAGISALVDAVTQKNTKAIWH